MNNATGESREGRSAEGDCSNTNEELAVSQDDENHQDDDATEVRANLSLAVNGETIDEGEEIQNKEEMSNIPSLVVAFCAALTTGGATYSFGLYGATLQKTLNLSEGQVDTISTSFFFAGLFSFLPGLCSDRFGTRVALITGGCLGCINLLLYWAIARQHVVIPHGLIVTALSILGIATFLSCSLVTGAVFKTVTVACQGGSNKGTAVGIAKGYVGLGSGLYVAIFEALRHPNESYLDFLPMAASFFILAVVVPGVLFLPTQRQVSKAIFRDDTTGLHFRVLYASLLIMALMIIWNSIKQLFKDNVDFEVEEYFHDEPLRPHRNHISMAVFLTSLWLLPIYSFFLLPHKCYQQVPAQDLANVVDESYDDEAARIVAFNGETRSSLSDTCPCQDDILDEEISLLEVSDQVKQPINNDDTPDDEVASHQQLEREQRQTEQNDEPESGVVRDKNLIQMLGSPSALLMLWTTTILVGAGTLESNNMSQMVQSQGFRPEVSPTSLALFSVAQAGARVFTGALSENAGHWSSRRCCMGQQVVGIPRPFFLVMASVVGLCAHVTLAFASTQNVFVVGATMAGAAFGMVWPLMVLIIGEVFGPKNIGANYMFFDGFTSAAGTFILSKIVAEDVYEAHVPPPNHPNDANEDDGDDSTCFGLDCFQMTHWIVSGLTVSCILTSIALQFMTRHIYRRKLLAIRHQEQ